MKDVKIRFQEFLDKSNAVHYNKYDYSLVNYVNTHTKVTIKCPIHNVTFNQTPVMHTRGSTGCKVCAKEQQLQTNRERFGTDYHQQSLASKQQLKDICNERYGYDNPRKVPQFKEAIKVAKNATNLKNIGYDNPFKSPIIRQQIKQTNKKLFDHESPFGSPRIRLQINKTNIKLYGHENPMCSPDIIKKREEQMVSKYGVKYLFQLPIKEQILLLENYNWLYCNYITLDKSIIDISTELKVTSYTIYRYLIKHNIPIKPSTNYSFISNHWIDSIMKNEGIYIQYIGNSNEFQIPGTRYRVDGYCKATNTVYEFHGDYWHGNPNLYKSDEWNQVTKCTMGELYQKTITKENKLRDLGYNIITIWESEYKENIKNEN